MKFNYIDGVAETKVYLSDCGRFRIVEVNILRYGVLDYFTTDQLMNGLTEIFSTLQDAKRWCEQRAGKGVGDDSPTS